MVVPSFLCYGLVCWPRKSQLAQLSWLDSDVPARPPQSRCGNRKSMMGLSTLECVMNLGKRADGMLIDIDQTALTRHASHQPS